MKVLFAGLFPMWQFHFGIELELIQNHLDAGDDVHVSECDANLATCEANPTHQLAHCARCIGIRQSGQALLDGAIHRINPHCIPVSVTGLRTRFNDFEDLATYMYQGFDVGLAVFSSLVDYSKDFEPDTKEHAGIIRTMVDTSARLFLQISEVLREGAYDRVYLFNGRYATARPWVRACERQALPFTIHERSGALDRYVLFDNNFPHEPTQHRARILEYWKENENDPNREQLAETFYHERRKGYIASWISFTEKQVSSELPPDFDASQKNVVLFASTEGEFVGMRGIYNRRIYPSQLVAVCDIAAACSKDPSIRLWLRIHPNSAKEKRYWWNDSSILNLHNITVIAPESKVSSYALMDAAWKIVVFGSTIGIEATFSNKPAILLGEAFYRSLDAIYEPQNLEEAYKLLLMEGLKPKPLLGCLQYGLYLRFAGITFRFLQSTNYYTLQFKGQTLEARQEVHEWLGACEKRPKATGIKKWMQAKGDRREFKKLWKQCDGWFARQPVSDTSKKH